MSGKIEFEQNIDHIGANFEWDIEPKCTCGLLKKAVDEQFIFVSNFTSDGFNSFYMMPITADGYLMRENGLPISHCPWCGDEIKGKKKYANSEQ